MARVSRAASLLGWRARFGFEDGARELATWARNEALTDRTEAANDELRRLGLLV